jgi:hypothetical protein
VIFVVKFWGYNHDPAFLIDQIHIYTLHILLQYITSIQKKKDYTVGVFKSFDGLFRFF